MRAGIASLIACLVLAAAVASGQTPAKPGPAVKPALDAPVDAMVKQIKVLPDKAPDCTSLKTIVDSVTKDCKTNDEKAVAVYNFMRLAFYHRQYPSEPGGVPALKNITCYGWSLCGGQHATQSALWRELGWGWRFVGWSNPGHTTVETEYDGKWHYLDVFLKFYAWKPDANAPGGRTIAGEDDLKSDSKGLLTDGFVLDKGRNVYYAKDNQFEMIGDKANWQAVAMLVCGDTLEGCVTGVNSKNRAGSPEGWAGINHATGNYSADVNLAPGYALTNTWDKIEGAWFWGSSKEAPSHGCRDKEIRNSPEKGPIAEPYLKTYDRESYANGELNFIPDLSSQACLKSFANLENIKWAGGALVPAEAGKPASVTVLLKSPYIMTVAKGAAEGAEKLEISLDGKAWKAAELSDFTAAVKGQVVALAKITIKDALKSLRLDVTVQNNPYILPYLSPGKNVISVSAVDAAQLGENKLVVTYAYRLGSRDKPYEQLCMEGKEITRAHNATWDEKPTVVQKVFAAKDLPAKFEIDVPTPKDKQPVFPRMLFVRREVVSPSQKPLPLPEGAQEPKLGPSDELKTVPNPLMAGIAPPPKRIQRAVTTKTFNLQASHAVCKTGDVAENHFVKWIDRPAEKPDQMWIMLVGGELKDLPPLKDISAARLVIPVTVGKKEAPTKVGVVMLKQPFEAGKTYDFANLGEVIGTMVVPKQPQQGEGDAAKEKPYDPPKAFKADITTGIRKIASGNAKFQGFAIRVVPDKAVDDNYYTRIDMPKQAKLTLEVDVYADQAPAPVAK